MTLDRPDLGMEGRGLLGLDTLPSVGVTYD